jgi:hypothetical protein
VTTKFYQTCEEELIVTQLNFFHELEREGTLTNSFYEAKINSSLNWIRTQQKGELKATLFNEHKCKNPQ